MSRRPNQKLKLLYLMRIFIECTDEKHAMTVAELSDALAAYEISAERKSLYDDMELLRVFGLDIRTVRDRSVRYYLGSRMFETAELKLLVDAVRSSRFITQKQSDDLIRKLERMLSKYEASALRRQLVVANRLKTENDGVFGNVDMIHRAISENRRIRFRYYSWSADKRRVFRRNGSFYLISPFALVWDSENYFLVGYDATADMIKHFRVDKMLEISIDKEKREGESAFEKFDLASHSKQLFGMYAGDLCAVGFECDKSLADAVIDRFGTDVMMSNRGDSFTFTARVMVSPSFYSWVLGFGSKMKIVYPEYVAEHIAEMARDIVKKYE
ncbi:MAG: WYL domain-containing protein [Clostridia bacterium]|nr:WYL domain-containing protein [Clostridia bacterium]